MATKKTEAKAEAEDFYKGLQICGADDCNEKTRDGGWIDIGFYHKDGTHDMLMRYRFCKKHFDQIMAMGDVIEKQMKKDDSKNVFLAALPLDNVIKMGAPLKKLKDALSQKY